MEGDEDAVVYHEARMKFARKLFRLSEIANDAILAKVGVSSGPEVRLA